MNPDTHSGADARQIEASDDQAAQLAILVSLFDDRLQQMAH
jgi:hypothetical protein